MPVAPAGCVRRPGAGPKSLRQLAAALLQRGHQVSYQTVAALLKEMQYGLQGTRKTREGEQHPDRDAQCAYIKTQAQEALAAQLSRRLELHHQSALALNENEQSSSSMG
jgi:hypothetical protein